MYVKKDETFIPFSERYLNLSSSLSSKKIINNDEKSIFFCYLLKKCELCSEKENAASYKQDAFLKRKLQFIINRK